MDIERIESLLTVLNDQDVAEFSYETEELRIEIRMAVAGGVMTQMVAAPMPAPVAAAAPAPAVAAPAAPAVDENVRTVTSPMPATFYRAPGPDAADFVEVGDRVSSGQVLCILEAMKMMNELESELDGEVVEILAENGKPVQFGQDLFKIKVG